MPFARFLNATLFSGLLVLLTACQPSPRSDEAARPKPAEGKKSERTPSEDSGGVLLPEQGAYDMGHCDLALQLFPETKSIRGTAKLAVHLRGELEWLVFDLDPRLKVSSVRVAEGDTGGAAIPAQFERRGPRLWIALGRRVPAGTRLVAEIDYGGRPREAVRAPWDGGFTWAKTKSGQPWIATTDEGEGGDLWWPCKDHPSDKPDSFALHIRVPQPLVVATNGRLERVEEHADGTRTYHWATRYPISNYNIALNIAPYETLTGTYVSVTGDRVPVTFWFLPDNRAAAAKLFPEMVAHLNFYERMLGPYPFRAEKYGVVETPHLGMEHQSIIAYGNKYRPGPHGYDWLHHHELGHEWWGNLVTAPDWRDFWIHEGLCTYMQALYSEEREGAMAYHDALYENRRRIKNEHAIVPAGPTSMQVMDTELGNEVYFKGEWVVHMLRYLVGRDRMLATLRRVAYPTPESERALDGSASHFTTTEDFIRIANEVAGRDLTWFFNLYLRQPKLPKLVSTISGDKLTLRWETPGGYPFPMPLEVEVDGCVERIEMPDGHAELDATRYAHARLDPSMWILKEDRLIDVTPPRYEFTQP